MSNSTRELAGPAVQEAEKIGNSLGQTASEMASGVAESLKTTPLVESVQSQGMSGYFEIMGLLFFGLGVLWFLLWLIKRLGKGNLLVREQNLSIESRLNLGQRKWLIVARVHGRRLALGLTEENISMLTELTGVEEYEANLPEQKSFLTAMKEKSREITAKGKRKAGPTEFSKLLSDEKKLNK